MNILATIRKHRIAKRLEATMRPDPDYRDRKLAQMTSERRARYWRNVAG